MYNKELYKIYKKKKTHKMRNKNRNNNFTHHKKQHQIWKNF